MIPSQFRTTFHGIRRARPAAGRWSLLAAFCLVLAACGDKPSTEAAPAEVLDPGIVIADEAMQARIKISAISVEPFSDVLRVAGRIDFDRQRMARIGAPVTGRVTDINTTLGAAVKPGDVLARLHSTELGSAQLAYLKARAQSELQQNARERARLLFAADVIGKAELQRRENEYAVAAAELRAASEQLSVLGMSPPAIARMGQSGEISSFSPVVSTLRGSVVEFKVSPGQVVQPADALFTVADLSRVWAVAEVPEQQADLVAAGQTVDIEVPALGNRKISGELIFVGQVVDPATRTVPVRTAIDNADGRLKPAMLATMLIASRPTGQLVIPASAVVRFENEDLVYVEIEPGRFRATQVQMGASYNGKRVVTSGLKAGDRVVVEGAFHLNNQRAGVDPE
ncbi:efflux RND transporter periplasmic adaptor subunit [Pigmentiphaga sp.]|uniref:efflux RND transporter periplasmic adaptor subunit n=1 Tax=Pigmentiphaga sp. TaxID=1977564 RepID=UPI00128E8BAD|nr:efflux RND transporter periplasmic adaptor subunit [Pigmentiphaga sp.]MPS27063.1 efflux RND transporter periplasmic adaptor subunit [Alcaligenaceae bacterium SAGV5]MPS51812.1 efflux RND transporter periplasmic adaptor subunit [Alcaligenaceae bacterium SAGV3]MPT58490.1 efflux RND transporter periplasmic adaptor subunit [Alcaligenaceae bacterium]